MYLGTPSHARPRFIQPQKSRITRCGWIDDHQEQSSPIQTKRQLSRLSSQTPRARYVESPSQKRNCLRACVHNFIYPNPNPKNKNKELHPNPRRFIHIHCGYPPNSKDRTELCGNMTRHPPPPPHPRHILNLDLPTNKHTIRSSSPPPPRRRVIIFPNPRRRARSPETHLLFKTSLLFILIAETLVDF